MFAKASEEKPKKVNGGSKQEDDAHDQDVAKEKIKNLSFELIDIGLHTGCKGLEILQKTTPYQVSDKIIHYEDRFE